MDSFSAESACIQDDINDYGEDPTARHVHVTKAKPLNNIPKKQKYFISSLMKKSFSDFYEHELRFNNQKVPRTEAKAARIPLIDMATGELVL